MHCCSQLQLNGCKPSVRAAWGWGLWVYYCIYYNFLFFGSKCFATLCLTHFTHVSEWTYQEPHRTEVIQKVIPTGAYIWPSPTNSTALWSADMSHDSHESFWADWFQTASNIKPTLLCTEPCLWQYNPDQVSTTGWEPTQLTSNVTAVSRKTAVLTPQALQRFLSHMNSPLLTLGWWHPVQRSTGTRGRRSPLHRPRRWVKAPLSLHAPTLL